MLRGVRRSRADDGALAGATGVPVPRSDRSAVPGERPPGLTPQLFAPGLVSTGGFERDLAITPDGREIYFGVAGPAYQYSAVVVTRLVDGRWTEPEVAPGFEDPRYLGLEPALSPDGNTLYFLSTRPDPAAGAAAGNQDVWALLGHPTGGARRATSGRPSIPPCPSTSPR